MRANEKLALATHHVEPVEYLLMLLSVGVAVGGILLARRWYLQRTEIPQRIVQKAPRAYRLLLNKYFVDEAYDAVVVTPLMKGSERLLWRIVDVGIIDWLVNATARVVSWVGKSIRVVQTGITESYVFIFLLGVVLLLGWLIAG